MKTTRVTALLLVAAAAGCSGLLDVKNPNNVNESDLSNPASAATQANGALSSAARAWGIVLTPNAMVTDELTWIGSRDAWQSLDLGRVSEPTNEFVDAAFPYVGEARWWSNATIKRLEGFAAASVLRDTSNLTRSYLYGAIAYTMVADLFNNFPMGSDKTTASPPLGPANMSQVYDTAIAYTTQGIALAQTTGDDANLLLLTAMRARARYAKALWAEFTHPTVAGPPPANPWVNDAGAVADANAALALDSTDWKYRFKYSANTVTTDIGFEVNQRLEMRIGSVYCGGSGCAYTVGGKRTVAADSIKLKDPIDAVPDPDLKNTVGDFLSNTNHGSLTVVSAREMHLIAAEAALAAGDTLLNTGQFAVHINAIRKYKSQTPYDLTNAAHPRPVAMLQYKRQVNLFLQGRRLLDHYRFNIPADLWVAGSEALTKPGTLFPITITELLANPYCVANPTACE
ncbi:MAG: hypothetical protein DMD29_00370 [Gemmatimonadetes bacterium]|nr:MAG: hypothetical protein DMD29_00370 [Gemmatimonadota bacterium]